MKYLTVILLLFTLIACKKEEDSAKPKQAAVKKEPVIKEFGFTLNDFKVVNDTIENGDTFGKLLSDEGYDVAAVHKITESIKDSFDLRDIRVGKPFTMLKQKKGPNGLQVFVYQPNATSYYVVDLRDSIAKAYKRVRPVTIKRRLICAEIEGSLSETLANAGATPALAHELSEVYAWSIDFFKIQKGDKFAVAVNEKYIDGTEYAGLESIESSYF